MVTERMYPFVLVRTAYHGGGVVSRHKSKAGAERARARRLLGCDCRCGCYHVILASAYAGLPCAEQAGSPYNAAR